MRELPKPAEGKHFTSALPEDTKDGMHSFRQIRSLFFDKELGYAEMKNLFTQMDINKGTQNNADNRIDDTEWYNFYDTVLVPFQSCDTDTDFTLKADELKECLNSNLFYEALDFSNIKHNLDSDDAI